MSVFDDLLDGKEVSNEISSEADDHIHMCSSWQDELEDMCSYRQYDTFRSCSPAATLKSLMIENQ